MLVINYTTYNLDTKKTNGKDTVRPKNYVNGLRVLLLFRTDYFLPDRYVHCNYFTDTVETMWLSWRDWNNLKNVDEYFDGLVQDCSNPIAKALEFCTKPSR